MDLGSCLRTFHSGRRRGLHTEKLLREVGVGSEPFRLRETTRQVGLQRQAGGVGPRPDLIALGRRAGPAQADESLVPGRQVELKRNVLHQRIETQDLFTGIIEAIAVGIVFRPVIELAKVRQLPAVIQAVVIQVEDGLATQEAPSEGGT